MGHSHNGSSGSNSNSLNLSLEWNRDALGMSAAQGARVASTLGAILSGVLASPPETPLRDLASSSTTMMSAVNAQQVQAWNERHARLDPVARCIHDVIADRVRDHPYVQAVCAWDGSLTFQELDAVSGRLAVWLQSLGVGPEVLVPLCFEKSVRSINRLT